MLYDKNSEDESQRFQVDEMIQLLHNISENIHDLNCFYMFLKHQHIEHEIYAANYTANDNSIYRYLTKTSFK